MTKELKTIIDKAEVTFSFLSKQELKLLKTFLELAHNQGKIEVFEKYETN